MIVILNAVKDLVVKRVLKRDSSLTLRMTEVGGLRMTYRSHPEQSEGSRGWNGLKRDSSLALRMT